MKKFIRAATASVLIVTTSAWSMAAIAGPIAPEAYLSSSDSAVMEGQRAQVVDWLQRDEVRTQMTRFGVSTDQAVDRVAALSDEEVQRLAEKIDSTPVGAGGGGVIGAVIFVFLVFRSSPFLSLASLIRVRRSSSSCLLLQINVVSSAYLRLVIFVPPNLTPPLNPSKASLMISSEYILNRFGDKIQPWRTPLPISNHSVSFRFSRSWFNKYRTLF